MTNEWSYIWAAFSITWVALAAYWLYVTRRVARAREAHRRMVEGDARS
jgi:hypothetical protein